MLLVVRGRSSPLAAVLVRRAMGTSRTGVHGSHSPTNTTLEGRDEAEEAIEKGKEEKRKAREQVEAKVDARIGSSSAPPRGESAK